MPMEESPSYRQFAVFGKARSQDPLFSTQVHLSYTLRPRLWAALDGHSTREARALSATY
jgi:hypothetical protein